MCRSKIPEKNWKAKAKAMLIRPEGISQGQRIVGEIILPRGRDTIKVKRYAELIGNYKN